MTILLLGLLLLLQSGPRPTLDQLSSLDDAAAIRAIASDPAATRQALDDLLRRFDASIHSDRQRPEQRRVQFDEKALALGVRVGTLYARATDNTTYARRFRARQVRMEGTQLLNDRRYADAVARLRIALHEAEGLDDRWLETITRINLAYGQLELGEGPQALAQCERANEIAATLDERARGLTLFNLGSIHLHLRNFARSIEFSRAAAAAARRIGIELWEGNSELNLAVAHLQLGDVDQARATFERALRVLQQTGDRLGIGRTLYNLALVAAVQQQQMEAAKYMERALPIIRSVDIRHSHQIELDPAEYRNPMEVSALQLLVKIYTKAGMTKRAAVHQAALQGLDTSQPHGHEHSHRQPK